MKKYNPLTLITAGLLLVIFAFMLFAFQVRSTEVAVVTTWGRFARSITEPDLYWRLPWPIQKVYKFDNRIEVYEKKLEQTTTSDALNLMVSVYVGWRIADPRVFLETLNGDISRAEATLDPLVRNVKNGVIARHPFSDLVSTNAAAVKFDQIEQEMLADIKDRAEKNYGMKIELLGIKQLQLPESITTAVFNRMKQERQTKIQEFRSQGDMRASIIRADANNETNRMLTVAQAEATKIKGDAEREAAQYYSVFNEEPNLYIFLKSLTALEAATREKTTLIVDPNAPPFNLLRSGAGQAEPTK
ncbi:MAG TPA: protease modulator HflC [Verrucomicrobiae bacterium]|nr:protease modulator HflC [Verrucomicrobiae bacterium]